jgi:redox-sensitive bicupin YhaK (pirin superfamily)
VSGPVTEADVAPSAHSTPAGPATVEVEPSRAATVGGMPVRRALPRRTRRTVGAWCFADHFGPTTVTLDRGADIGPHPHLGLQTVTWIVSGELVHSDSLGSEQTVRPGQLNLMTAGHGVAHAEESAGSYAGELHGVQLWVAQPAATRDGAAAFEHHATLPQVDLDGAVATVLVGSLGDVDSPGRRDTDHVGVEIAVHGASAVVPLRPDHEHALVVLTGAVSVDGVVVSPGHLGYLGTGRSECALAAREPSRVLLLGGTPFPEPVLLWWNFAGRDRSELTRAWRDWTEDTGRFGTVASRLPRIETAPPPWG